MDDFNFDIAPEEVQKVWVIQMMGSPIGSDLYKEVQDIISRNPKYFPYETAYNKVPQEVHESYLDEMYPNRHELLWECSDSKEVEGFCGIISLAKESAPIEKMSVEEIFKILIDKEAQDRKKQIWDKHYKKYGLEFRD